MIVPVAVAVSMIGAAGAGQGHGQGFAALVEGVVEHLDLDVGAGGRRPVS